MRVILILLTTAFIFAHAADDQKKYKCVNPDVHMFGLIIKKDKVEGRLSDIALEAWLTISEKEIYIINNGRHYSGIPKYSKYSYLKKYESRDVDGLTFKWLEESNKVELSYKGILEVAFYCRPVNSF